MDKEKEILEKIEKLEKEMKEKDEKIASLEKTNSELTSKIASAKVDGLVRKVEETTETKPVEDEEITFDFDIR